MYQQKLWDEQIFRYQDSICRNQCVKIATIAPHAAIAGVYPDKCSATETDGLYDRQVHTQHCQIAAKHYRLLSTPPVLIDAGNRTFRTSGGKE